MLAGVQALACCVGWNKNQLADWWQALACTPKLEVTAVRYDTVIIGAGMSGLSAGVRLAYYEKNVLILERHTTIGGLNSFYRLRKRNYDVGLHAVTNYAEPGTRQGPLSKLL